MSLTRHELLAAAGAFAAAPPAGPAKAPPFVFAEAFGCVGDGVTDDTANLQAAITYCLANGCWLRLQAKHYLVTRSLNQTVSTGRYPGFFIEGEGPRQSVLLHALTEPFPVVDSSGNTAGGIRRLGIRPAPGGSQATCGFLAQKAGTIDEQGRTQFIDECYVEAGTLAGHCAAVFVAADQSGVRFSRIQGKGGGLSMGVGRPAGVVSKFVPPPRVELDWTKGYIIGCHLIGGQSAPAFTFTGGTEIDVWDTYFALGGEGSAGAVVELSNPEKATFANRLRGVGFRTENQSKARGVAALRFTTRSHYSDLEGELDTDDDGVVIRTRDGELIQCRFVSTLLPAALLDVGDGGLQQCVLVGPKPRRLGQISARGLAATQGLRFGGDIPADEILQMFGSIVGLEIEQAHLTWTSQHRARFPPGLPRILGRDRIVIATSKPAPQPHRGADAAGDALVDRVHLGALSGFEGYLAGSFLDYEAGLKIDGDVERATLSLTLDRGAGEEALISRHLRGARSVLASVRFFPAEARGALQAHVKLATDEGAFAAVVDLPALAGGPAAESEILFAVTSTGAVRISSARAAQLL